ncbi:hypothetical protein [Streptomyces geranii]|uniref:hypothetical protein n=1 Tax=Streptomyces geranii TaxID=2058923 RepID=UPI000D036A5F|nr:hypothetical protein [Streptomyces geranii]
MNEFQEMPSAASAASAQAADPSVHQLLFRWEGNQGRQSTGMTAVAHSCSAERADQLARELGPLLWVSGSGAARPSIVRTLSRSGGEVLLARRWPAKDPGGRPSTVTHVLMGAPGTLKTRQCLGLTYGGWQPPESAEQVSEPLSAVEYARLKELARQRLPQMRDRLKSVRHALILTAAEWLRDPSQRVSLLVEETNPPGWPDRNGVPLVYLGLFLLFGSWPGHDWTFATYDTVDTHPLNLTSVPRWEEDTGGAGPLARVPAHTPTDPRFEHHAAVRLVDHLLTNLDRPPGVPQLTESLKGGAALDRAEREERLRRILGIEHRETRRVPRPEPAPAPAPAPAEIPYVEPYLEPRHDELHDELCAYEPGQHMYLDALLRSVPDEVLMHELHWGELPAKAEELVLTELGREERRQNRPLETRHALCAQVLAKGLHLPPHGQADEHASRAALMQRAADLFTWAVAPLVRDERHHPDLRSLLNRMCRDPHPTAGNWLQRAIISPPIGGDPDLPPAVWQPVLGTLLTLAKGQQPTTSEPTPTPPPTAAQTVMARIKNPTNNPGWTVGAIIALMVVLITTAVILA